MFITKSGKLLIADQNNLSQCQVNGNTVNLEGPVSIPEISKYAYLLKCGSIERLLFENAGSGYIKPTFTCSGLSFAEAVIYTGIVSYKVLSGKNITANASIFISPPYGVGDFVLAKQSINVDASGNLISVVPACMNVLGCGYTYDPSGVNPVLNIECGNSTTPPQLVTTLVSGSITSVAIPSPYYSNCGSNYPATVDVGVSDITGSGAIVTAVMNGDLLNYFIVVSGGHNYTNPFYTLSPGGSGVNILPLISTYIGGVTITSGIYFYNVPTINVADNYGSGAVPYPIMAGVLKSDIVTYSGTVIPHETYITPTMKAGFNLGSQPTYPNNTNYTAKNRYHQGIPWAVSGPGTLTASGEGTPISWTQPASTVLTRWTLGTNLSNAVDSFGTSSPTGIFTLKYIDNYVNTVSGSYLSLSASNAQIINLSGPNINTTSGILLNSNDISYSYGGGITGLTIAHTALGSGYTCAIALCSNSIVVYPIVQSGIINNLNIICPGTNITSTPTITIYGLGLSGTTITEQINVAYSDNPSNWQINLGLTLAQSQGQFLLQNIFISDPDPYTGLATDIDFNQPLATQDGVLKALKSKNGQVPSFVRFMDINQSYHGDSSLTVSGDLSRPTDTNWYSTKQVGYTFYQARYVNTNPADTGYSWYTNKVYGDFPFTTGGPDSFGKYLTLNSGDYGYFTGNYLAGQNVVVEFIGTAHNFKSGQYISAFTPDTSSTLPLSDNSNWAPNPYAYGGYAWVTGPSSVIVSIDTFVGTSTNNLKTVNSNTVVPLTGGWYISYTQGDDYGTPYQYSAQFCKDLGCDFYINIPLAATPSLVNQLVDIANTYLGPDQHVYLEYGNEIWNGFFLAHAYLPCLGGAYEYLGIPFSNLYVGSSLQSSNNYQIFASGWKSVGRDVNSLHYVYGSWMGNSSVTSDIVEACQENNLPIHYIAVAPYADIASDVNSSNLIPYYTPIGAGGSGWPPGAINDIYRTWFLNSNTYTGGFAAHKAIVDAWGQPSQQIYFGSPNIILSGGNNTGGPWQIGLTFIDYNGLETTFGNSLSVVNSIQPYWQPLVLLPALPWWASGVNVYINIEFSFITPTPVWVGQMIQYTGLARGTYTPGSFLTISDYTPPTTGFIYAPTVNYASGYINSKPSLITYEGATQNIIPNGLPLGQYVVHDCQTDPSAADRIYDWYAGCQNGGCEGALYFGCYNGPGTYDLWALSFGTNQLPGSGHTNKYSVVDGRDHNAGPSPNVATMLQGFLNFIDRSPLISIPSESVHWQDFRQRIGLEHHLLTSY